MVFIFAIYRHQQYIKTIRANRQAVTTGKSMKTVLLWRYDDFLVMPLLDPQTQRSTHTHTHTQPITETHKQIDFVHIILIKRKTINTHTERRCITLSVQRCATEQQNLWLKVLQLNGSVI